jgi:Polyketide cyclase / dehydrase and lipid transport
MDGESDKLRGRESAPANRYALVTQWHLAAAIDRVWDAIYAVESWPLWWKYVLAVEELEKGESSGVGAVRRYKWSSRLPYQLSFNMRSTVVQRPHLLEGEAAGELIGIGRWNLSSEALTTRVRYDWEVVTSRAWMNTLAPIMAPIFRWNHGQVMAEGARGLARYLGVRFLPP